MKKLFIRDSDSLDYIEKFIKENLDSKTKKIIIETGQYGFLLVMKKIDHAFEIFADLKAKDIILQERTITEKSIPYVQFVEYVSPLGITIRLELNEELDTYVKDEIDLNTGFPIKSSTLYIKEVI